MIKISDKYYIKSDDNQYILCERGTIKDPESKNFGNETENILGYYSTIEHALQGLEKIYGRRMIVDKDYTLKQAIDEIRVFNDSLIKAIKGED